MKIASIVGARPNFVKLAPMHKVLKDICDHTIIHTGQHYDYNLSKVFFKEFDLPEPEYDLEVGSSSACSQIGEIIKKLDDLFSKERFDIVLVYGDTNSTIAGAMAANKSNVRIGHIEAGLRSKDKTMPEEINRILTDHVSDYLFAPTENAIFNLKNENVLGNVFFTGDLSVEIVQEASKVAKKEILEKIGFHTGHGKSIISNIEEKELEKEDADKYILLTLHRAENTLNVENIKSVIKAIELLSEYEFIFPIHPRTKKFIESNNLFDKINEIKNLKIIEPVGYTEFISLLQDSYKIITDSGGAQKEAYILGIPCITIRKNTEWIETINEGWNILTGTDHKMITEAVRKWNPHLTRKMIEKKPIFGDGKTSTIISDIISKALT